MGIFAKLEKSWVDFKKEIGYNPVKIADFLTAKDESTLTSTGGTTYDRYDEKYGLHTSHKKEETND